LAEALKISKGDPDGHFDEFSPPDLLEIFYANSDPQ
jgi:hypothetical protein